MPLIVPGTKEITRNYLLNDESDEHERMAKTAYLMSPYPFPIDNESAFGLSLGPLWDILGATSIYWRLHASGHKGKYLSLLKSYGKLLNGAKEEPACLLLSSLPHAPAVASWRVKIGKIKSVRLIAPKKQELEMCPSCSSTQSVPLPHSVARGGPDPGQETSETCILLGPGL